VKKRKGSGSLSLSCMNNRMAVQIRVTGPSQLQQDRCRAPPSPVYQNYRIVSGHETGFSKQLYMTNFACAFKKL
jgi:hypothetical protein